VKNICLYHGIDLDGFCSGAIYAKHMERIGQKYELIPANYGWELPWEEFKEAHVTLIDFSIQPWEEFKRLSTVAGKITWIDHHKSAIDEWRNHGLFNCPTQVVLDVNKAGCELAWEYYFPSTPIPWAVRLLGRYDVWDHGYHEDVLPFQYGLRLHDMDPREDCEGKWSGLLSYVRSPSHVLPVMQKGRIILRYQSREDEIGARAGCFTLEWEGLRWIAANRGGRGSKFFDSVWDPKKYDGMMGFNWNGEVWTVGLYSDKEGINCEAIAKRCGGGGHPGAAGFRCRELPFDLEITHKLEKDHAT